MWQQTNEMWFLWWEFSFRIIQEVLHGSSGYIKIYDKIMSLSRSDLTLQGSQSGHIFIFLSVISN